MASQSLIFKPADGRSRKIWDHRRASMDVPEQFREDDEDEEDAAKLDENNPAAFVQQSVYGILTAARSKGNLRRGLKPESESDSETEAESSRRNSKEIFRTINEDSGGVSSSEEKPKAQDVRAEPSGHRKDKKSESTSLRSVLTPIRERSDAQSQDPMTHSQFLPSKETVAQETDRPKTAIRDDATVMDRHKPAGAKMDVERSRPSHTRRTQKDTAPEVASRRRAPQALPDTLAEIFRFDEPEDVISEYECCYLQSVLLQGHLYITQRHVCFFAYLKKKGTVIKSGHLSKQGKRNPRYRRYWFVLQGNVLSYYVSSTELYFPSGTIDLQYGTSADVTPESRHDKNKEVTTFTITTESRTYFFRADSATSAKEWVKQLRKVIFRSRNDGDSVKISLPLVNIVDVEPTSILDFADTVKLRVVDNDVTYAVDDYLFTFFSQGQDAVEVLKQMTQGNDARKTAVESQEDQTSLRGRAPSFGQRVLIDRSPRLFPSSAPPLPERVCSAVSPTPPRGQSNPRLSSEQARRPSGEVSRRSFDRGRASFDGDRRNGSAASSRSRRRSPISASAQDSTDSSIPPEDSEDYKALDMSASQVLKEDTVFGSPTLKSPPQRRTVSGFTVEQLGSEPQDSSPRSSGAGRISTQPLSNTQLVEVPTKPGESKSLRSVPAERDEMKSQSVYSQASTAGPIRAIAAPLQRAYNFAGVVRQQGKRMSSYLSSNPKIYYDRFSGAIAGGKRHYSEPDGLAPEDRIVDTEESLDNAEHERRFQEHFSLPATEKLRAVYYCWLHRVLPLYGKVYISDGRFCFRSLLYGTRTKLVVPHRDIENVKKEKLRFGYPGMVLVIRGHEELFFDFGSQDVRDDCVVTAYRKLEATKADLESTILTEEEKYEALAAAEENEMLQGARKNKYEEDERGQPRNPEKRPQGAPPILFDDPNASLLDFRPKTSLRITCLTIGSRGDVQPYVALCKGLKEHGHHVKIATHTQFEGWIRKHGIDFAPVEGDPAELMRICVENGMFTPSFVLETHTLLRGWMDRLLATSWSACQNSDLLIESPSAMAGIHIAEALGIPYFRAFGMPWTKTRAYPHAFATSGAKRSGQYNYMTYILFDNFFWQFSAGHINRWRRKTLNLRPTDLGKLQPNKVPFLYNFSPSVVPPPLDFSDWIRVTGYWFLDEGDEWTPPEDLLLFIKKAREDNMKLVYIGFGSVPVSDSQQLTQQIVDAVLKADVRCIFSKGWSDHFGKADANAPELPSAVFQIRSAPHDWLFQQIDAAVHHGGCGTTGASLRAGLPTVVKPFFGDQFFFGSRVEDLGVGVYIRKITAKELGRAIWMVTHDERMRKKARALGEQIRQENGVDTAINAIYRDLEYANTLVKKRGDVQTAEGGDGDETEESWTFVENDGEGNVDVTGVRRTSDSDRPTQGDRQ